MERSLHLLPKFAAERKAVLIENIIIPKKQTEKTKPENDPSKISSSALFVREVNNYKCQPKKK